MPAQRFYAAIRAEVDVTPRWFGAGGHFLDDIQAILATWREAGGDLLRMTTDFQAGVTGVRFVLAVPAGVTFEQVEAARAALKAALDALDLSSPRRRAVTEAREAAVARRQPAPQGEGPAPEPDSVAPPLAQTAE